MLQQRAADGASGLPKFSSDCVAKLLDTGRMWPTGVLGPPLFSTGDVAFRKAVQKILKDPNHKRTIKRVRSDCIKLLEEHTDYLVKVGEVSLLARPELDRTQWRLDPPPRPRN